MINRIITKKIQPLLFLLCVYILNGCYNKLEEQEFRIVSDIGKIKVSKWIDKNIYNVYISVKIINNMKHPINLRNEDLDKSIDIIGIIGSDTIFFDLYMTGKNIPAKDSIPLYLYCNTYVPKSIGNFENKLYKEELSLYIPVDFKDKKDTIVLKKNDSTPISILDDNVGVEGAFEFGDYEFGNVSD